MGNIWFVVQHYKFVLLLSDLFGKFFKNSSGDQVVARSLFCIDFIFMTFLTSLIRILFIGKAILCGAFKSLLMVFLRCVIPVMLDQ
jgi:hypothetical protein